MSCCVAKRQAKALGFRLLDEVTGQDVVVGETTRTSRGSYMVLSIEPGMFRDLVATVGVNGRVRKIPVRTQGQLAFIAP